MKKQTTPTPAQLPILRKAFEAQATDSHGFALGIHGGYRNPAISSAWRWFVSGAGVVVPPLVDNQQRLIDALQALCNVQGIEAIAINEVLGARQLIASTMDPHAQGRAARAAGGRRMDNPYWRKCQLDSDDCKAWDAGYTEEAQAIRDQHGYPKRCAVRGIVAPGAACGKHRIGGGCGLDGACEHQREAQQ